MAGFEVLLIGGRSGVGKSTVAWEVSRLLQGSGVAHCVIEGDNLDSAYPAPPGDPRRTALTEANLAALWRNYAALGYRRAVYTNTVSVLESGMLLRAMGGQGRVLGVLLTAEDGTAAERLAGRERGSGLAEHLERSARAARRLAEQAPPWVVRVATDGRTVAEVAREVVAATGWDGGGRPSAERVVEAVARLTSGGPGGAAATRLVAVDGPGGSGKSTLAAAVAERLPGGAAATAVVHGDDFYRPMDEQERAGLSPEQGYRRYFDWERLRQEVLEPLRAGRTARYRRYDWATGALGGWAEEVRPGGVVLVEGVYTARPELERWYDLTVWVHTSREECLRRVRARGENDEAWIVRWRAAEEYGATATRPELRAGLVVGGA